MPKVKEAEKLADSILAEITKFKSEPVFNILTPKTIIIRVETIIYEQQIKIINERNKPVKP